MDREALDQLRILLIEELHIPAKKVKSHARILHDLGVDADDAVILFRKVYARFNTDLRNLDQQWALFFNTAGLGPRFFLSAILVLACGGAASVVMGRSGWLEQVVYTLAIMAIVAASSLVSRRRGTELRPLTVAGLANVIQAGHWPSNPRCVC